MKKQDIENQYQGSANHQHFLKSSNNGANIDKLERDLQNKENQLNRLKTQLSSTQSETRKVSQQNQQLAEQNRRLEKEVKSQEKTILTHQNNLRDKEEQVKQLDKQVRQLEQNIRDQKKKQADQKRKMNEINFRAKDLDAKINKKQELINLLKKKKDQHLLQVSSILNQVAVIDKKKKELDKKNEQHLEYQKSVQNAKQKVKEEELKLENLNVLIKQKDRQKQQLQINLKDDHQLQEMNQQAIDSPQISSQQYQHLFTGDVLDEAEDYKPFLVELLQKKCRGKIKSTKLIYRFDTLNHTNFHQYVDQVEQIVIVIKLTNGYILGGWSGGSFVPKTLSKKSGLIFSLTNRVAFELWKPNVKAIVYDDFYLIFGNSELRLKSLEKKIFSNFGINNGYYNNRGEKVNVLLGSGELREVELQTYQIFQLKFS